MLSQATYLNTCTVVAAIVFTIVGETEVVVREVEKRRFTKKIDIYIFDITGWLICASVLRTYKKFWCL